MNEETEVGKDSKDLKQSLALVALSAILRYESCQLPSSGTSARSRSATVQSKAHLSSPSYDPLVSNKRRQ